MSAAPRLELDLPAVHRHARVGRRVVRSFARIEGMGGPALEELSLVVSELLSNCVDHGGGGGAMEVEDLAGDARMRLELELGVGRWELAVSDQGGGSIEELLAIVGAEPEIALLDERGRGFLLLRDLVDDLEVETSEDGRGLLIRVRRTAAKSAVDDAGRS